MAYMNNNNIVKAIKSKTAFFTLNGCAGQWLSQVRNWIQWNCLNGSSVTWGSQEYLNIKPMTVNEMEALAAEIARATLQEFEHYLVTEDEMRALQVYRDKRNWKPNAEGKGMVFDPQHGLHFAQWKVDNGWEVAEFDEEVRIKHTNP